MSCNCQLLPTLRDGIKWIYAKETKRSKENEKKMIAVIRLLLKQCLLIQFLDDSSFDNIALTNLLAATNYDVKSMEEVMFLLLKKRQIDRKLFFFCVV